MSQTLAHCSLHQLFPPHQSAYCPHHSCETALVKLVNDMRWDMETGGVSVTVFLDLSAAFDTVDHDNLETLQNTFAIKGTCLDWYHSYLSPRWCQTVIGQERSSVKTLRYSVPQGSCLGPMLFTMYAGSLAEVIPQDISLYGYADDHSLRDVFNPATPGAEESSLIRI